MKKWLMVLILFLPAIGVAERLSGYALQCPGQTKLISAERYAWNKAGENIQSIGVSLPWELIKRKERLQKVSSLLSIKLKKWNGDWKSGKFDASTDWRTGIRLQPNAIGLPNQIDGCQVIPIFAPHPVDGPFVHLGSLSDFENLDFVDQIIVMFRSTYFVPEEVLRLALSEKPIDFTSLDFVEFMMNAQSTFWFRGQEMKSCKWTTDRLVSECSVAQENPVGTLQALSTVTYSPIGNPKTFVLARETELLTDYKLDPAIAKKVKCDAGLVRYRDDETLFLCGQVYAQNGVPRTMGADKKLVYLNLDGAVIGQQIGVGIPTNNRLKEGWVMARDIDYADQWFNVFPDNEFQAGLVKNLDEVAPPFYLEVDAKGRILRRIVSKSSKYYLVASLKVNLSDKPIFMYTYNGEISEFKVLVGEPSCKDATILKTGSVSIPPGCVGLFTSLIKEPR